MLGDAGVGAALGHGREHLALARRQHREAVVAPALDHQLGHDLGIERRATTGDAAQRIGELAHVGHAVLEQVADAAGPVGQQLAGVLRLHVLAQHQHRRARHQAARLDGRAQALVTLGRRHAHVDDRDVGPVLGHRGHERRPVADGGHDRGLAVLDEPDEALAQQDRILGDDDPQMRAFHGPMMPAPRADCVRPPGQRTWG